MQDYEFVDLTDEARSSFNSLVTRWINREDVKGFNFKFLTKVELHGCSSLMELDSRCVLRLKW